MFNCLCGPVNIYLIIYATILTTYSLPADKGSLLEPVFQPLPHVTRSEMGNLTRALYRGQPSLFGYAEFVIGRVVPLGL